MSKLNICLNPEANGGEQVHIDFDIFNNGDDPPDNTYCNTSISGICYGESSFKIGIPGLTPDKLREIANKLEKEIVKVSVSKHNENQLTNIKKNNNE